MIRPFTLMTLVLAGTSGLYLFAVKHRAQVLDDQLAAVAQASRLDEQRIRVLQAQWALEIDPNRLQKLATQFSSLQPMKPAQLVSLAALPQMLPPAGEAAPASAVALPLLASNAAAPAADPNAALEVADKRVAMLPMPPPEVPAITAPALTAPASHRAPPSPAALRALLAAKTTAKSVRLASARRNDVSRLAHNEWAEALPPPRPLGGAQTPMGARVMSVSATPAATVAVESEGQGGSMLGMASDLAPPQPVSGN